MEEQQKILIVDDEEDTRTLIRYYLESMDFMTLTAGSGIEAIDMAQVEKPDLIILDVMMPGIDGFEVCKRIRSNFSISHIPILFLTAKVSVEDTVRGLNMGGDDYLPKPFDFRELTSRIHTLLRRTQQNLNANPLTNLPGNIIIQKEIEKMLNVKANFAVCLFDIDNFKSYNDKYGYDKGDKIIIQTSKLIIEAFEATDNPSIFIGHIGGDDFIAACPSEIAIEKCEIVTKKFDELSPSFYVPEDRERGFIECISRKGEILKFPFVSISAAIVTNEERELKHPGEIAKLLAELRAYAKNFEGSKCVKDRRKN